MTVTRKTFGGLSTCAEHFCEKETTPGVVRWPRSRWRDSTRRDALFFDTASSARRRRRRPASRSPRPFPAGAFSLIPWRLSTGRRTSPLWRLCALSEPWPSPSRCDTSGHEAQHVTVKVRVLGAPQRPVVAAGCLERSAGCPKLGCPFALHPHEMPRTDRHLREPPTTYMRGVVEWEDDVLPPAALICSASIGRQNAVSTYA